jgi:hypothetical protein
MIESGRVGTKLKVPARIFGVWAWWWVKPRGPVSSGATPSCRYYLQ